MRAQQQISLERNRLRIGTRERVLIEELRGEGNAVGRSAAEAPDTDGLIFVTGAEAAQIGTFVNVRLVEAQPYDLIGVME